MQLAGKRVLVTGAGGFIGSHLAERLVEAGASVRALVHYRGEGAFGWLQESPAGAAMQIVPGDIRDAAHVRDAVNGSDIVFHLAALIAIPYSYQAPLSYVQTNVAGTANLLVAARDGGVARFVHASTSEVYGTPERVPITEAHPLRGQSPYAATKIGADKLVESFHHAFALPAVVVRPFNTFGPRQSMRAVVPTILTQLLKEHAEIEIGATAPRRDLTFVDDTVTGFIRAAECDAGIGRVIQLGTGRDVSIGELADLAMQITGHRAVLRSTSERMRPPGSEVDRLLSQPSLAAEVLGWTPAVSLEEGLRRTARWLRDRLDRYEVTRYHR